jgi:hypothetical protein
MLVKKMSKIYHQILTKNIQKMLLENEKTILKTLISIWPKAQCALGSPMAQRQKPTYGRAARCALPTPRPQPRSGPGILSHPPLPGLLSARRSAAVHLDRTTVRPSRWNKTRGSRLPETLASFYPSPSLSSPQLSGRATVAAIGGGRRRDGGATAGPLAGTRVP